MGFKGMEIGSDQVPPKNEGAKLLGHNRPPSADKAGHYKLVEYQGPASEKDGNPEDKFALVSYADGQEHSDGKMDEAEQLRDKIKHLEILYKDIQQVAADMLEIKGEEDLAMKLSKLAELLTEVLKNNGLDWMSIRLTKDRQSSVRVDLGANDLASGFVNLLKKMVIKTNILDNAYDVETLKEIIADIVKLIGVILKINGITWKRVKQIKNKQTKIQEDKDAEEIRALIKSYDVKI